VVVPNGLLKNAHLLRCAANLIARRISIYASGFGFLRALHLSIFEQPAHSGVFQHPANGAVSRAGGVAVAVVRAFCDTVRSC